MIIGPVSWPTTVCRLTFITILSLPSCNLCPYPSLWEAPRRLVMPPCVTVQLHSAPRSLSTLTGNIGEPLPLWLVWAAKSVSYQDHKSRGVKSGVAWHLLVPHFIYHMILNYLKFSGIGYVQAVSWKHGVFHHVLTLKWPVSQATQFIQLIFH